MAVKDINILQLGRLWRAIKKFFTYDAATATVVDTDYIWFADVSDMEDIGGLNIPKVKRILFSDFKTAVGAGGGGPNDGEDPLLLTPGLLGTDCNAEEREWHLGGNPGSTNYPSDTVYWYVNTIIYNHAAESRKLQVAYRYAGTDDIYVRHYYPSAWSAWTRIRPTITAGTAAPSGGADGDIHFRYV